MTREEFIGRSELLPDVRHTELVGGIVCMPSPGLIDVLNQGLSSPEHAEFVAMLAARRL